MKRFGPISRAIASATLLCFAAPQAEAVEVYVQEPRPRNWTRVCSFRPALDAAAACTAAARVMG